MVELYLPQSAPKDMLYRIVNAQKISQFNSSTKHGIDLIGYLKGIGVIIEEVPFKTKGLRGAAFPADLESDDPDIIMLNSMRTDLQRNFDCAHEMIHICLHWKEHRKTFSCVEKISYNQSNYLEWQANEGAAEMLVPLRVFVPIVASRYVDLIKMCPQDMDTEFYPQMIEKFKVPKTVIGYRLHSLKYEIDQYVSGVPLENIRIMSNREQIQKGIQSQSIIQIQEYNYFVGRKQIYVV